MYCDISAARWASMKVDARGRGDSSLRQGRGKSGCVFLSVRPPAAGLGATHSEVLHRRGRVLPPGVGTYQSRRGTRPNDPRATYAPTFAGTGRCESSSGRAPAAPTTAARAAPTAAARAIPARRRGSQPSESPNGRGGRRGIFAGVFSGVAGRGGVMVNPFCVERRHRAPAAFVRPAGGGAFPPAGPRRRYYRSRPAGGTKNGRRKVSGFCSLVCLPRRRGNTGAAEAER